MSFDEEKREINESPSCAKKKFKEIPIKNAFIRDKNYWDKENELLDKVKVNIAAFLIQLASEIRQTIERVWWNELLAKLLCAS